MAEKFKPYAAAYLILLKGHEILLLKRFNTGYQDGNYSLVSGHFEGNETAKQCIIREAKEEAGIHINPEDLDVVQTMHRLGSDREYFCIYLLGQNWSGEIINTEPNKCDDLRWFKLDDLPINIAPEVKFALENFKKKLHYTEFGWQN